MTCHMTLRCCCPYQPLHGPDMQKDCIFSSKLIALKLRAARQTDTDSSHAAYYHYQSDKPQRHHLTPMGDPAGYLDGGKGIPWNTMEYYLLHTCVTPDASLGINHVIVSVHGLLARNLFETTETDITTRETTTSFAPHFQIMVTIGASTLTRYL